MLKSISRICKRRLCDIVFTPKRRKDQVFCSEICADRQGKEDWKNRNRDKVNISINKRRKERYATDEQYANNKRLKSNKRYHDLTDEEKFIRNKNNRLRENKTNKRIYMRKYHRYRNKYDMKFRITNTLRSRVRAAIKNKGGVKSFKTMKLIGCSINKCIKHLEKQFKDNMSWSNYGKWHIDHKIPCVSFDLSKISEQKECFNYKNLQPLWAIDNLKKHEDLILPDYTSNERTITYYSFPIILKEGSDIDRKSFIQHLESSGVETRAIMCGTLPDQPSLKDSVGIITGDLKISRYIRDRAFFIGCHPMLKEEDLQHAIDTIDKYLK